ncbi:hypothetical protein [Streptomyces sp. NPDC003077]|uniref:hypothetical protein n=1 Tax=Streptomyces sp. NPDC003077 TaxID=3154443 RepID=UPI0033ABE40F
MVAAGTAALVLPLGSVAWAAEPAPGSSQGGSPGPSAPSGYRVTTELPKTINVDTDSGATTLTAKVVNQGDKATDAIRMSVVGYKGMTVKNVDGCMPIPEGRLPKGSNSGFVCAIDKLDSGKSRSYNVTARFDLKKQGKICLPVTLGNTTTLLWQQGPVDFGTTRPIPDAPDTPLLLGTANVPAGAPGAGSPSSQPPAQKLPSTGAPDVLPMAALAAALVAAGGTGVWWTSRRARRH